MRQLDVSSGNTGRVSAVKPVCLTATSTSNPWTILFERSKSNIPNVRELAYSRVTMDKIKSDYVRDLCSLIQVEHNQVKFLKLLQELNRVLSEEDVQPASDPLRIHN